jgi:hypothetical protein
MSHEPVEASLRWQGKICPLGDLGPDVPDGPSLRM